MTLSRRSAIKIGLGAGAGALPLLGRAPLLAELEVVAPRARAAGVVKARPLPLSAVRLHAGPLKHAQEPDRMLAYYRDRAGLQPKAEPYGGWDGDGRNLTGHIAGHYLSAVSLMWSATGDPRFKQRADYLVGELEQVQDAHGDGYLSALKGGRKAFAELARGEIRSAAFDLNGEWSPWYTLHKTYAGLRDAYRHTGNRTALDVEIKFAAWAEHILSRLDDAQLQHMMNTEFGGMNEVMCDLYTDTGDARWLALSYKFEHRAFLEPLERHEDDLAGAHANTQIPKILGSAARFLYTGTPADLLAAGFFWDRVVQHHSFSSGGHGKDEYFGPADELSDWIDGRTAETCNVYNMLKLTRRLFSFWPDPHYADYHERALFNHILASIDPEDGRVCYMVPVGPAVTHEYQDMHRDFTCDVGTGMESHALHGDGIYYEAGDRLWVNLYVPSRATWAEGGVQLVMETDFPEGETAKLELELRAPKAFTLALRRPYWAGPAFLVKLNGQTVVAPAQEPAPDSFDQTGRSQYRRPAHEASSYVELQRQWRSGDVVEIALPKGLHLEPLPDNPHRLSLMWGPLVLAGDLGPEPNGRRGEGERPAPPQVPVFVAADPVVTWLKPVAGAPGHFRTDGVGREPDARGQVSDVDFQPFFRLHRRTYSTYWDVFTPAEWDQKKVTYAVEAERLRKLAAATVAYLQPGEVVFERQFNYQAGEGAVPQRILGRPGRRGRTWFSYDLPVEPTHPLVLIATYFSGDRRGTPADFEIQVDGRRICDQQLGLTDPHRFFDLECRLPEDLVRGKSKVTVRFQAKQGSQIATVFGLRMIRGDSER